MTLPSQFSLEEENFYKDIQDLVKNGSQNEKELSLFLQRYMDLLTRTDLDEETFIINFTKAGFIIEASARVYGTKVDRLWLNLEHVLESLKNKNQEQSKKKLYGEDGDELEVDGACGGDDDDGKKKPSNSRKRRKVGDALLSADDFLEIDNITGLLGKNMNENSNNSEGKIKLCEKVPNMFIKNKKKKKKIDVCLNKCMDDKDVIRLRDWVISSDCLLIKEIYTPRPENILNSTNVLEGDEAGEAAQNEEPVQCDDGEMFEGMDVDSLEESIKMSENLKDEKNNNTETAAELKESLKEATPGVNVPHLEEKDGLVNELNVSKESDLAKFPNVLDRLSGDCLVDVDEVFWSSSKFQDVIPSKKMRAGKTNKPPCQLCADKKVHKKRGKRCIEEKKLESLDSYFMPHVQPSVSESPFGILPDEDLYNVFKIEMKLIEELRKVNACRNVNEAYHPEENPEELRNFLGFDGFENCLMRRTTGLEEDEMSEDNLRLDPAEDGNDNCLEDSPPPNEFELPFPVTENTLRTGIAVTENDPGPNDDENFANSEAEYQQLVIEELKDHYAAKTSFAKNKELGLKISKWHEMIADKIKLSQKRGALNMNSLAGKIMEAFPSSVDGCRPTMAFKELVRMQTRRDVPRYFFACLQLTNERNLDISKSNSEPLATDCMIITRLRSTRANCELDESTVKSPSKQTDSPNRLARAPNRKRNSLSRSPTILESKNISKNKKVKQKIVRSHKRPKNFSSVNNSKRRRCSVSSADSLFSD